MLKKLYLSLGIVITAAAMFLRRKNLKTILNAVVKEHPKSGRMTFAAASASASIGLILLWPAIVIFAIINALDTVSK